VTESLRTEDGRAVLRMQRHLRHPQHKVWRAITDPDHLEHWFPFAVELDLQLGAKVTFTEHGGGGSATYGVVTELDPPRVFAFSWGEDVLHWELRPDGDGCLLALTHMFGDRAGAASFAAGWHACIEALDASLDGRTATLPTTMAELARAHEARITAFGLDRGTAERTPYGWQVRFERQLTRPVDAVWAILTGGATPAVSGAAPAAFTTDQIPAGPIIAVDAPTLLEYAVPPMGSRVRWRLRPGTGHGARLTLHHTCRDEHDRDLALTAWRDHIEALAARVATP